MNDFDISRPHQLLATGFGSGLAKKAPGTWGTLAAMPFGIGLMMLPSWIMALVILVGFFAGIWICQKTSDDLGVHDHGGIVWDEFIGMWIALFMVPMTWWTLLVAFGLFRLFDIVKPWPIKWLDAKVHGGLGIMIDDVLAGIFALAVLQAIVMFVL